jgi:ribosome biogenesis protein ENP2
MNVTTHSGAAVYTVAGSSTARELPEWLIRKRKRSLKTDPEFANRIELLQDFAFPEASSCVRVSEDGNWVMSTGTYKPQIHTHYLPDLALSFARHTDCLNLKFVILSQDISKSLHLQTDRYIEFHKQGGLHHKLRIPRYGRDLVYNRREAEALIPAVGVTGDGAGEVYRLNLELGRFMKPYEVDVGGDDLLTPGASSLQGGINTGAVNTAAVAEESHNLLAFGTSIGTVEFWDPRVSASIGILGLPSSIIHAERPEVTALQFQKGGMIFAAGDSTGMTYLYDMRSPSPIQKKDHGNGFPIKNLVFLESSVSFRAQTPESKILTADKKSVKIWDRNTAKNWAWVEPEVELNHVEWCPDSGMLLTANEGRQQHAFFIPQLGPAPKWCSFLDNVVEELAEDTKDPHAFSTSTTGAVFNNFKFLTLPQLQVLSIDHLIGNSSLLRPYMHGYFVPQKLFEEANTISNPTLWEEQRAKKIQQKIEEQRESRIRGRKKIKVRQNKQLAERIMEQDEKNERRKAKRALAKGNDKEIQNTIEETEQAPRKTLLSDSRFAAMFEDGDYQIDENSKEFAALNPVRKPESRISKGLTAVDEEELDQMNGDGDSNSHSDGEPSASSASESEAKKESQFIKSKPQQRRPEPNINHFEPVMTVTNSKARRVGFSKSKSFGSRLAGMDKNPFKPHHASKSVVGERSVTFVPHKVQKTREIGVSTSKKDRRSASGNAFRGM